MTTDKQEAMYAMNQARNDVGTAIATVISLTMAARRGEVELDDALDKYRDAARAFERACAAEASQAPKVAQ